MTAEDGDSDRADGTPGGERRYRRLSPEQRRRVIREVNRLEELGALQPKSERYPSLVRGEPEREGGS